MDVLPVPKGSQAIPNEGPMLPSWFLNRLPGTQLTVLLGVPPATIAWLGTRMLFDGVLGARRSSQRSPISTVRFLRTFQGCCLYNSYSACGVSPFKSPLL